MQKRKAKRIYSKSKSLDTPKKRSGFKLASLKLPKSNINIKKRFIILAFILLMIPIVTNKVLQYYDDVKDFKIDDPIGSDSETLLYDKNESVEKIIFVLEDKSKTGNATDIQSMFVLLY